MRSDAKSVTLPEIDTIRNAPNGVVDLARGCSRGVQGALRQPLHESGGAQRQADPHPGGQDGWTDDQIRHGRDVLEFLLTDYPGLGVR